MEASEKLGKLTNKLLKRGDLESMPSHHAEAGGIEFNRLKGDNLSTNQQSSQKRID